MQDLSQLASATDRVGKEADDTREALGRLSKQTHEVGAGATAAGGALRTMVGVFGGLVSAQAVMSGVRAAFSAVKTAVFEMNASLETSTLQFQTLMGDADLAREHVRGLFDFAKRTPFETGPIIEASRMMRTFGGAALDTKANLQLLGDASAGTGAPINELGFWVGRLYSNLQAGKPFGEAAMRLQELAVLSPKARGEMEALQQAGKSAQEIFAVLGTDVERFSGAMELQASTWKALISTLTEAVNLQLADSFKGFFDTARDTVGNVVQLLGDEGLEGAIDSVGKAVSEAFGTTKQDQVRGLTGLVVTFGQGAATTAAIVVQAWAGIKTIVLGAAAAVATAVEAVVVGVIKAAETIGKIPAVGPFRELSLIMRETATSGQRNVEWLRGFAASLREQTAEAARASTGHAGLAGAFHKLSDELGAAYGRLQLQTSELGQVSAATKTLSDTVSALGAKVAAAAQSGGLDAFVKAHAKQLDAVVGKAREAGMAVSAELERAAAAAAKFLKGSGGTGGDKPAGFAKSVATLRTNLEELAASLDDAAAHGERQAWIDQYGTKLAKLASAARLHGIALKDNLSAALRDVQQAAFEAADRDVARIADKIHDRITKANQKLADATGKQLLAAVARMTELERLMSDAKLTETDRRLAQIERERQAELSKLQGVGAAYQSARATVTAYYDHQERVARGSFDTIEERMRAAGVQTRADLERTAAAAKRDFEQMRASGLYTADALREAWQRWYDAERTARGEMGIGWRDLWRGIVVDTRAAVGNAFTELRTAVSGSFAQMLIGAKGFRDGWNDIWESMKATALRIFNQIAESFITSMLGRMAKALGGFLSQLLGLGGSLGASLATAAGSAAFMPLVGTGAAGLGGYSLAGVATGLPGGAAVGTGGLLAGTSGLLLGGAGAAGGGALAGLLGKHLTGGAGLTAGGIGAAGGAATGALIGSVVPGLGTAVGALVGGVSGLFGGLFGQTKGQKEGKAADAQIRAMQAELLATYGSLDKIREVGGAAGQELANAWGDKNVAGLRNFTQKLEDFTRAVQENEAQAQKASDARARDAEEFGRMGSLASQYGIELGALGEQFHADRISAGATQIVTDFNLLIKHGADAKGVLTGMSDEISALVQDAVKFGTAIPAHMRPLVEQLMESGQLLDEHGEKITDLSSLKFADPVAKGFQDVVAAIKDLGATLTGQLPADARRSAQGIQDAFRGIRITVPVEYEYDRPEAPAPAFASGGIVPQYRAFGGPIHWMPRGTDTVPAMLTPGELVLNAAQQTRLASLITGLSQGAQIEDWLLPLTRAVSAPAPPRTDGWLAGRRVSVTLQTHLNGRVLAEETYDDLAAVFQARRLDQ